MTAAATGTVAFDTDLTYFVADAETDDRTLLGGKGAGLVSMTRRGLRVPPAFVLATSCCAAYLRERSLPESLVRDVHRRLAQIEAATGRTFGGADDPLLLSVRSGAPISMPGMMDTVLNLGLDRSAAIAVARRAGSVRFMADILARFHAMYAEIVLDVMEVPASPVDAVIDELGDDAEPGAVYDAVWRRLQDALEAAGEDTVPDEPHAQLLGAIAAVFRSWNTRRAITYRELHGIDHAMGTAVVVQTMVFGNRDEDSGSGVVFSRNPVTGEPGLYGEYLAASQGEDVVAGIRTPEPVASLAERQPDLFEELRRTVAALEEAHRDVLDIEFTVESGVLYFLQVRSAKRTAPAAVRIAADFLREHGDAAASILETVTLDHIRGVVRPAFDEEAVGDARASGDLLVEGTGASPGNVSGIVALDPDRAGELARSGVPVILVREVTSPTDLHGMIAATGVVTATGGATSHAAVVARALGKTCVVGCAALSIDAGVLRVGGRALREGDWISVDGGTGEVFAGRIPVVDALTGNADLDAVMAYCRTIAGVDLLARAATAEEIARARHLGAVGVVVAAADALATSPDLADILREIGAPEPGDAGLGRLSAVIETAFAPLFAAAGDLEFGVRAIDFLVDETSELLQSVALTDLRPELALPVGVPALLVSQLRGLAAARRRIADDDGPRVHLSVRNVSDAGEADAIVALAEPFAPAVVAGAYIASPRGALAAASLSERLDPVWVELRLLQAAMLGLPPRVLLTAQPLERYVAAGLLSADPRHEIDASVEPLLQAVMDAAATGGGHRIGWRVSGPVSEPMLARLRRSGLSRIAVDVDEAGPALLALAKAAVADRRGNGPGLDR
ncbi:pyruvate, phosphate dikinase [Microbacterium sp.]|uniref:pyruvate, phosphate dikinase n=1 Tax=Microbacterium sp. TaxID=51671 RepID=UPI003242691E